MLGKRKGIFVVLALAILPTVGLAGPGGHRPLAGLVKQADAIVVGRASHLISVAPGISTTIDVLRVLKGTPAEGEQIHGLWTPSGSSTPPGATGVVGVWFLQAGQSGQWEILPPMTGDVPFAMTYLPVPADAPSGAYAVSPSMDPFDKVICEIASALQVSGGKSQLGLFVINGAADSLTSVTAQNTWARIAESTVPVLRVLGLQVLIRGGDATALARLASDTDVLSEVAKQSLFAASVCDFRNPQDAAVLILGDLTKAELPAQLRNCAAHALRAIHTQKALPMLAALLDTESADLRYEGVVGLASFANALPMGTADNLASMGFTQAAGEGPFTTEDTLRHLPTIPVFLQDEMRYVSFWKAWWAVHSAELSE